MGNWTRVKIEGTCAADEVLALQRALTCGPMYEGLHCLSATGGLCSLPNWAAEHIAAVGNLAERDFSEDDIAEELQRLSQIAPSLDVKIHVGSDYESSECVATVNCSGGDASVDGPEIDTIPDIPEGQIHANLMDALSRA